jgi:hypothetical protein
MTDYPQYLPCPSVSDYKGTVDFGLSTVTFNRGNKRRRRLASTRLETYDLSFVYTTLQLWQFQSWANIFGYDWHYMPIVTHYSGLIDPASVLRHRCRLTSDINITALNADTFRVKVSIEIDPSSRPLGVIVPSARWIIGGAPPAPSAPDWIIAQTPTSPSLDIIAAGTPVLPAA